MQSDPGPLYGWTGTESGTTSTSTTGMDHQTTTKQQTVPLVWRREWWRLLQVSPTTRRGKKEGGQTG